MQNYNFLNFSILLFSIIFFSCGSSKKIGERKRISSQNIKVVDLKKNNENLKKNSIKIKNRYLTNDQKIKNYIKKYSKIAEVEMRKYKIPVSITLAQGILESGIGEGRLAVIGNNHFGIKCHKKWKGKRMYHDDDKKGECFRVYKSPELSYRDHSIFLSTRSRYDFLFDLKRTNYKSWAKGLKKAGYATDPKYSKKLISLIERYSLDRFDKLKSKKRNFPNEVFHIVVKGDTLYSISKKYNISIREIIKNNNIKGTNISLGQILKIP